MHDTTFDPLTTTNPQFFPWRVRDALDGPAFEALRPRTRLFAVLLATCADTNGGSIWRSVETFARMTGYSDRTIKRMIAELEAAGRLDTQDRTGKDRTKAACRTLRVGEDVTRVSPPIVEDVPEQGERTCQNRQKVVTPVSPKEYREEYQEEIKITTPPTPRERGARSRRPRAADRRAMGPDYTALHVAGIEAAETAEWADCGDCGSTVLADMTRCPTCGSTAITTRPVVGQAREDTMLTTQKPAPAPRLPAVPAVPAAAPAPIVDPPFDPSEAFAPQPKPTPVMPPDPEFADVLGAYKLIRQMPLTDLERDALAQLPPADTLSWLAQSDDGAEGLRGTA